MVAPIYQPELSDTTRRILEIITQSGLPGDKTDHLWMAKRVHQLAAQMDGGDRTAYISDLLISGLLLERGLDPAQSSILQGRGFPEHCLHAAPRLLALGCPQSSWPLVENGILKYAGKTWGKSERWVIEGQHLKPFAMQWHELGERLMLRNVAKALAPLIRQSPLSTEIKLTGVGRGEGRRWISEIRNCLESVSSPEAIHFFVDA